MRASILLALCTAVIALQGCFDLDSHMFNTAALSSYTLSTSVIPESSRVQVVLNVNGHKVYGYYVTSNGAHPDKVILYQHGNRDHMQIYWNRVEYMYEMGFNVFIYDYEGFGMSEGECSEGALYDDATNACNYLRGRGFADSNIVVYGFSLGCVPSTYLAQKILMPWAMILEAPFASSSTLALSGMLISNPYSFVMNGTFDNVDRMKDIHTPLLVIQGLGDRFIDIDKNGRVVFNAANQPKQFIAVPGADHSEVPQKMGESLYVATIREFVLGAR